MPRRLQLQSELIALDDNLGYLAGAIEEQESELLLLFNTGLMPIQELGQASARYQRLQREFTSALLERMRVAKELVSENLKEDSMIDLIDDLVAEINRYNARKGHNPC